MRGEVKFFNRSKGYGFVFDQDENEVYVYHTQIKMQGFRYLDEGDIVDFGLGEDSQGRKIAVDVVPVLTLQMIKRELRKDGLRVCKTNRSKNNQFLGFYLPWIVVDENNFIQSPEQGMSLIKLAEYAGLNVEGLN